MLDWLDKDPVFGRLPVVTSYSEIRKTDLVILQTDMGNGVTSHQVIGPGVQNREIVASVMVNGKPVYLVNRDEVFRTSFQLQHPEGKPLPIKLQGRFTTVAKALEAACEFLTCDS